MKVSVSVRVIAIGFVVALALNAAGATNSFANSAVQNETSKVRSVIYQAAQQSQERTIKLRYYGGPKSPMYQ